MIDDRKVDGERKDSVDQIERGERYTDDDRGPIGERGTNDDQKRTGVSAHANRPIALLFNTQRSLEKFRIQLGNRVSAIERQADEVEEDTQALYERLAAQAELWEQEIEEHLARYVAAAPVWNHWLKHVKGIGPSLAAPLLVLLLPPLPDAGPSTWYKAAGLVPELRPDGTMRLPRARAGEGATTYHRWLRRCLYNVATSFVRVGGYYRDVYDREYRRLTERHAGDPQWPKHRVDDAARWAMIKLFLSHLWEKWLEAEGYPNNRRAYVVDVLGHHYIAPPEPVGPRKL